MKKHKGSDGFSKTLLLLIVAGVAVIGFAVSLALRPGGGAGKAGQGTQYLTIKEFGVRMPLSAAISDAYYAVSTSSFDTEGNPNSIWLGLKSLDTKGCPAKAADNGNGYPLGSIIKAGTTEIDPISGSLYNVVEPNGTTIGDTYYAYHSGTANQKCASAATLKKIDAAFKTAAKSITVTPVAQ
jgi:hypothetical protein